MLDIVSPRLLRCLPMELHSDWLEVKMETDESPDPDHSPTESSSSSETSPQGAHTNLLLSPPLAFADPAFTSPPQNRSCYKTPPQQVHTTPTLLCRGGSSFPRQTRRRLSSRLQQRRQDSQTSIGTSNDLSSTFGPVTTSSPLTISASSLPGNSLSIMATASMMNSTYALRSPGVSAVLPHCDSTSSLRTPCILVTDSVMGNSPFALRSCSSSLAFQPVLNSTTRLTPTFVANDSVIGNSLFTCSASSPASTTAPLFASTTVTVTPTILATSSVLGNTPMKTPALNSTRTLLSSVDGTPSMQTPTTISQESSSMSTAVSEFVTLTDTVLESVRLSVISEGMEHESMNVSQASVHTDAARELTAFRARMESIRNQGENLNEELLDIKGQFFNLLDDLGLSHDIYYNTKTPAQTPSQSLQSPSLQHQLSVSNLNTLQLSGCRKTSAMSTPRTPRRGPCGRQRPSDNMRSMYADLLIEQLLAQADTSDTSNSPPDPEDVNGQSPAVSVPSRHFCNVQAQCLGTGRCDDAYDHAVSVNINRADEDTPTKDSAKSKDIPALNVPEAEDGSALLRPVVSCSRGAMAKPEQSVTVSQVFSTSANESINSIPTTTSNSTSSSGRSVPDLEKELVSRIQYYSDFTIDRQKKIDKASEMPEENDENSPPHAASDASNESISHRCVEGSENGNKFVIPQARKPLGASGPLRTLQLQTVNTDLATSRSKSRHGSKHRHHSSDLCESDTSSGTGSMPRSQQSSSRPSSKHSSRDRHSAYSSSVERRSSSRSSRGSRCSTHPLASSTLISDPSNSGSLKSNGSHKSGSVYTWSLENSSDENLHQSYLQNEKRERRRSRKTRRRSSTMQSGNSHLSHNSSLHPSRPVTMIGADSPPQQQGHDDGNTLHLTGHDGGNTLHLTGHDGGNTLHLTGHDGGNTLHLTGHDGGNTLHLTHMVSMIDSPARRFGGRSFENSTFNLPCPRSNSLPRTSTRIGCLVANDMSSPNKASSVPELSNPTFNNAVSQIGPSNLSSGLQQTGTDGSGSSNQVRPELQGKSSTSESTGSYYSQCSTCNPQSGHVVSPTVSHKKLTVNIARDEKDELLDEILTNSPQSYDSSGVHPPYNSYNSPAGSTNEYTTVSDSSPERGRHGTATTHSRCNFPAKTSGVFKVPSIPVGRTVKRSKVSGHVTQNVGVRVMGTPHAPLSLVQAKEPVSRRKLFNTAASTQCQTQAQPSSNFRGPKILDRKALVRKFKKFSTNFKKDKESTKFHTLANL